MRTSSAEQKQLSSNGEKGEKGERGEKGVKGDLPWKLILASSWGFRDIHQQ
jgi:hypothetical protein